MSLKSSEIKERRRKERGEVREKVEILSVFGDPAAGLYALTYMRVCADESATDEEIIAVCNAKNPSGTSCGWSGVVRSDDHERYPGPVRCADDKRRQHILVTC